MAPNSSVNVTHISKQYFVLGQPDGSLWAGDQDGEWEGELSSSSGSHMSFALWVGTFARPSTSRLAPGILSTGSFNLAAIDTKISGSELKLWIWSFVVGAKALARININHLI